VDEKRHRPAELSPYPRVEADRRSVLQTFGLVSRTFDCQTLAPGGMFSMETTSSAAVSVVPFKPGDRVSVAGRPALFVYARGKGAVVRYPGERGTRVVPLAKVIASR
jgi:hypothetical protein